MINKLNDFQIWIKTVLTALIGVLSGYFIKELTLSSEKSIFIVAAIVIIVVISKIVELTINTFINKFEKLRKILLGNHFIEGYWIERIADAKKHDEVYFFAIVKITFVDYKYVISGETFDEFGDSLGVFHSKYSDYQNYILNYSFEALNTYSDGSRIYGNCEFRFTPSSRYPIRLMGTIFSNIRNYPIKILADKIDSVDKNKIDTVEMRKKLIEPFLESYKKIEIKDKINETSKDTV